MSRLPATATPGNFWTPQSKETFHNRVAKLNRHNREPCRPENYRQQNVMDDESYVLKYGEELQLTDHIAFLAQDKQGWKNVSAVTVEEDRERNCLTLRVASNVTPSDQTITGLTEVFRVLEIYARKDLDREGCREQLFDKVVTMSANRIFSRMGKLRKSSRPSPNREVNRGPLHMRIRHKLTRLKSGMAENLLEMQTICHSLTALAQCFEDVRSSSVNREELVKKAVRQSSEVSALGNSVSLESHLRSMGVAKQVYESREVLQIDKISRYFGLCNDLLRCCRKPSCRPLFSNIRVERCISPAEITPPGAEDSCRTHGEVQLILYYERHPKSPPPRAIGSSKSACLLCDLFVKAYARYHISHSHKRLYHQWTIPDTDWMTAEQIRRFQVIVTRMSEELAHLLKTSKKSNRPDGNGIESRAHLPLLQRLAGTVSTPSVLTPVRTPALTPPQTPSEESESQDTITAEDEHPAARSPSSVTLSTQALDDLPLRKKISLSTSSFSFETEGLSLIFDFRAVREGALDIMRAADKEGEEDASTSTCIDVGDVPAESEMLVSCPEGSQTLRLCLDGVGKERLCLLFDWGVTG